MGNGINSGCSHGVWGHTVNFERDIRTHCAQKVRIAGKTNKSQQFWLNYSIRKVIRIYAVSQMFGCRKINKNKDYFLVPISPGNPNYTKMRYQFRTQFIANRIHQIRLAIRWEFYHTELVWVAKGGSEIVFPDSLYGTNHHCNLSRDSSKLCFMISKFRWTDNDWQRIRVQNEELC